MKTFNYIFVSILLLTASTSYSQQWSLVPSPNADPDRNLLRGVWANSSNDVWAVGESGLTPSYTVAQHWNGVNWEIINSPSPGSESNVLNAEQGVSSNDVYAVGYTSNNYTPQMLALHWNGSSWTHQSAPTVTGGSSLQTILIFGPDDIYAGGYKAVGAPGPTTGTLITHWNGSGWNIEESQNQPGSRTNYITSMKGLSSNDIWAVGHSRSNAGTYQNMVLHKTGSDWNLVPVPQPGLENFLYNIDIISSDNIVIAGQYNTGTVFGVFFLHYDGSSWTVEYSPGGGSGMVHNSANDIWSSGTGFVHYDGSSWNTVSAPVPNEGSLLSMSRVSSSDIWAVGRYFEGNNLKSLTMHYSGVTSVTDPNTSLKDYRLEQNYPNPFNPSTNLEFGISDLEFVSLKVFDISGKEVSSLVNEVLKPGNYKYKFDAIDLPSGTYFYRLSAGDFTETKSMILLK
jgi:hypothetical protein